VIEGPATVKYAVKPRGKLANLRNIATEDNSQI